jgi:hypothetical protein
MWTNKIVERFNSIPPNPRENDYYAPYNKLLNSVFPVDTDFTVVPQSYPVPDSRESIDFVVEYLVEFQNKPVFVLEIKSPGNLSLLSKRQEADNQIRRRLRDIVDLCPLDKLYGASAFGTKLCIYNINKDYDVYPEHVVDHPTKLLDTAPTSRWNTDILTGEGSAKLAKIFDYVKNISL